MHKQDTLQIEAILNEFCAAWKRLDGNGIADCFDLSSNATVIGTDPGEYTVGMDAYRKGWAAGGYPIEAKTFDWEEPPSILINGDTAWSHGVVEYDLKLQSQEKACGRMWITTVLQRKYLNNRSVWRIMHLHASYA